MNKFLVVADGDFDLTERICRGFACTVVGDPTPDQIKSHKFTYVSSERNLKKVMEHGGIPVFMGRRWNEIPELENGVNGFYSNNLDEIRWIIKRLLEKSVDELKTVGYNSRLTWEKTWSM